MQSARLPFHGSTWCLALLCAGGFSSSPLIAGEQSVQVGSRYPACDTLACGDDV